MFYPCQASRSLCFGKHFSSPHYQPTLLITVFMLSTKKKAMICISSFITQQYVSTLEKILLMIKHTKLLLLAERLRYDPDRYTPVAAAATQEMSLLHRA